MSSEIPSVRNDSSGGFARISNFVRKADNFAGRVTSPIKLKAYQLVAGSIVAPHIIIAILIANLAVKAFKNISKAYEEHQENKNARSFIKAALSRDPMSLDYKGNGEELKISFTRETKRSTSEPSVVAGPSTSEPVAVAQPSVARRPAWNSKTAATELVYAAVCHAKDVEADTHDRALGDLYGALTEALEHQSDGVVEKFQEGINHGVTFERFEAVKGVAPSAKHPAAVGNPDQKLQEALGAINTIVGKDNKAWGPVLQALCTQLPLNAAFNIIRTLFNAEAEANAQVNEAGVPCFLEAGLPENLPPVRFQVIRNRDTKEIEKVKFYVEGHLEAREKIGDTLGAVVKDNIFEGTLRFTVTLDENNRPLITGFQKVVGVDILPPIKPLSVKTL